MRLAGPVGSAGRDTARAGSFAVVGALQASTDQVNATMISIAIGTTMAAIGPQAQRVTGCSPAPATAPAGSAPAGSASSGPAPSGPAPSGPAPSGPGRFRTGRLGRGLLTGLGLCLHDQRLPSVLGPLRQAAGGELCRRPVQRVPGRLGYLPVPRGRAGRWVHPAVTRPGQPGTLPRQPGAPGRPPG